MSDIPSSVPLGWDPTKLREHLHPREFPAWCARRAALLEPFRDAESLYHSVQLQILPTARKFYGSSDFCYLLAEAWSTAPESLSAEVMWDHLNTFGVNGCLWLEDPIQVKDVQVRLVLWGTLQDGLTCPILVGLDEEDGGDRSTSSSWARQFVSAAWALLAQPGLVEVEQASRPAGRKAKQKKKRPPEPVNVINLRRAVVTGVRDAREAERTHRHRWIVRGHWRSQPCGPGRSERRHTYIAPYVKGPEGAPMLKREKVYRW